MRKILLFIVCVLCFALGSLSTLAAIHWTIRIPSSARMKAVGVGVYWDSSLTIPVVSVSWGVLEPGQTENRSVYVANESNVPIVLSLTTDNWNPANASTFMTLTWNYEGASIPVSSYEYVTLSLHVNPAIAGITTFTFDITITGSG